VLTGGLEFLYVFDRSIDARRLACNKTHYVQSGPPAHENDASPNEKWHVSSLEAPKVGTRPDGGILEWGDPGGDGPPGSREDFRSLAASVGSGRGEPGSLHMVPASTPANVTNALLLFLHGVVGYY